MNILLKSKRFVWLIIYSVVMLGAFVWVAVLANRYDYFGFDLSFSLWLQGFSSPILDRLMAWISYPGYPPQMGYIVGAFFLYMGIRRWWREVLIYLSIFWMENNWAYPTKYMVDRLRPSPELVNVVNVGLEGGTNSFPAGHVLTYVCFFGFVGLVFYKKMKSSFIRNLILIAIGLLIALIGLSRVYTGEHWISDSIGGYMVGSIVLSVNWILYILVKRIDVKDWIGKIKTKLKRDKTD